MTDENPKPFIVNQNVTSHHQSGGITAHTVQIGQVSRSLDKSADLRRMLLDQSKNKKVIIYAQATDNESMNLAAQILKFLSEHGYAAQGQFAFSIAPYRNNVRIIVEPEVTKIEVGPPGMR